MRTLLIHMGRVFGGVALSIGWLCSPARSADLALSVLDRDGHGVTSVVVTAMPEAGLPPSRTTPKPAVMDQQNKAFTPLVLAVQVGTRVDFPNNDSVSHQVYSFSPAKPFKLPLYKGKFHPPVTFDQPGLVVLGCNIHDSMTGYIYVSDTPYFGITDGAGSLRLEGLPSGDYRVTLWGPFIADPGASLVRTVHVDGSASAVLRVQLIKPLRAEPSPKPMRRDWEY